MKTRITFILSLFLLLSFQLPAIHTQNANEALEPTSVQTILKQQQTDLREKAAVTGLSKEELRLQKKLDRKIRKMEKAAAKPAGGDRSWIAAVLLSFFLGGLGIDLILILVRALQPKNGTYTD